MRHPQLRVTISFLGKIHTGTKPLLRHRQRVCFAEFCERLASHALEKTLVDAQELHERLSDEYRGDLADFWFGIVEQF